MVSLFPAYTIVAQLWDHALNLLLITTTFELSLSDWKHIQSPLPIPFICMFSLIFQLSCHLSHSDFISKSYCSIPFRRNGIPALPLRLSDHYRLICTFSSLGFLYWCLHSLLLSSSHYLRSPARDSCDSTMPCSLPTISCHVLDTTKYMIYGFMIHSV